MASTWRRSCGVFKVDQVIEGGKQTLSGWSEFVSVPWSVFNDKANESSTKHGISGLCFLSPKKSPFFLVAYFFQDMPLGFSQMEEH
jgi:hypothetical protein